MRCDQLLLRGGVRGGDAQRRLELAAARRFGPQPGIFSSGQTETTITYVPGVVAVVGHW